MFICRIFLFRLQESPRYLVHAGRPQDAVYALQQISNANGLVLQVSLEDVEDSLPGVAPVSVIRSRVRISLADILYRAMASSRQISAPRPPHPDLHPTTRQHPLATKRWGMTWKMRLSLLRLSNPCRKRRKTPLLAYCLNHSQPLWTRG